ncbi:hypothetical protein EV385_0787 [Krasilnikovia cinnamomea]|uniref:Uncharacterized protein n=1 Tax=Krasilnikovia cinnamomea TaxID=349313 RepID=A0A4Q7ZEA3_9ACTN|nr:hypothetical protein EV385_0787 [Krasilnikovia cinnamomea]
MRHGRRVPFIRRRRCGLTWPCPDAEWQQLGEAADDLVAVMGNVPPDLYERFLGWIHLAARPDDGRPGSTGVR